MTTRHNSLDLNSAPASDFPPASNQSAIPLRLAPSISITEVNQLIEICTSLIHLRIIRMLDLSDLENNCRYNSPQRRITSAMPSKISISASFESRNLLNWSQATFPKERIMRYQSTDYPHPNSIAQSAANPNSTVVTWLEPQHPLKFSWHRLLQLVQIILPNVLTAGQSFVFMRNRRVDQVNHLKWVLADRS